MINCPKICLFLSLIFQGDIQLIIRSNNNMHLSSLILFTLVLIIVLNTIFTSGKIVNGTVTRPIVTPVITKVSPLVSSAPSRRRFGIASNAQKKKKKRQSIIRKNDQINPSIFLFQ